jgi:hypothetical protein
MIIYKQEILENSECNVENILSLFILLINGRLLDGGKGTFILLVPTGVLEFIIIIIINNNNNNADWRAQLTVQAHLDTYCDLCACGEHN